MTARAGDMRRLLERPDTPEECRALTTISSRTTSAAAESVSGVRTRFEGLSTNADQIRASHIVFGNLQDSHSSLSRTLEGWQDRSCHPIIRLTANELDRTARLYTLITADRRMTFHLLVVSEPQGASVLRKREGDVAYKRHSSPTNTTLEHLAWATWMIRLRKDGYHEEEKEYDPSRETVRAVHFLLRPL